MNTNLDAARRTYSETSGRTYLETHPWIDFQLDLRKASHKFWMLLAECEAHCRHIAGVPVGPEIAEKMQSVYLVKGVRATTAIEGNTLTEEEVSRRVDGVFELPPSREYLGKEIDNILNGCNQIYRELRDFPDETLPLNVKRICEINHTVLDGLELEEGIVPGQIRDYPVVVEQVNYRGAPPQDCVFLLNAITEWLSSDEFGNNDDLSPIQWAILKSIVAHIYLVWIHPFGDGNGRTARLVEFQILLNAGVPTPTAHLLSNHYNETRSQYYRRLDAIEQPEASIFPFVDYALEGLRDGLMGQLSYLHMQQFDTAWEGHVHAVLPGKSATIERQRNLALDLYSQSEIVPRSGLITLTPRLALAYAQKTGRTLSRDLNILEAEQLIVRIGKGFIANKGLLLGLLPRSGPSFITPAETLDSSISDLLGPRRQ